MAVHFKYNLDFNENILITAQDLSRTDNSINDLKIRIEENIKILKEQIYQLLEKSFINKSDITRAQSDIDNFSNSQKDISILLNRLNSDFLKFVQDIEDYKKITNERIEKLFKLIVITNEKLGNKIT
jgi:hypothetical protein